MKSAVASVAVVIFAAATVPAVAQDVGDGAAAAPPPICTDRPTKANAACTVPAGVFQIETDVVNWTRNSDAGVRTDLIYYTNPLFKYGLGAHTDLEANIAPYVTARTSSGGTHDTIGGVANLAKAAGKATFYAELWTAQNLDPGGHVQQYSADVAMAYLLGPSWQVDLGGNFGLNHYTPDAQAYFGLSAKF